MARYQPQRELFSEEFLDKFPTDKPVTPSLKRSQLESWQKNIFGHQEVLFKKDSEINVQGELIEDLEDGIANDLYPLKLTPLPLNFWKWANPSHTGPAIYVVLDKPECLHEHIVLYIGETIAAEQRWKGDHDCKDYISAYTEAINKAGLKSQMTIRFWTDVPTETKARRKLEQNLIRLWLPPFNKETRSRWQTPFTYESR